MLISAKVNQLIQTIALASLSTAACFNPGGMALPTLSTEGSETAAGSTPGDPSVTTDTPGSSASTEAPGPTTGLTTGSPETTTEVMATTCVLSCGDASTTSSTRPPETGEETTAECVGDCTPRKVFATLQTFTGDFLAGRSDPLIAADKLCQTEAEDASLAGDFIPWIGTNESSPSTRLDLTFHGPYELVVVNANLPAVVVAHGTAGLLSGTLQHAIDADASGQTIASSTEAWTGTLPNGESSDLHCAGWSVMTGSGTKGSITATDGAWTEAPPPGGCQGARRLYCIQT